MIQNEIKVPQNDDGGWVLTGNKLLNSLKHIRGFVEILGCAVNTRILREFCRIYNRDYFIIYPSKQDISALIIVTEDRRNISRFWDNNCLPESPPDGDDFAHHAWHVCEKRKKVPHISGIVCFKKENVLF